MSKIICDVCGTSYPESATQCPICGCVRSVDPVTVAGDTNEATIRPAGSYTHVKGGRFSKSNVKRRTTGKPVYNAEPTPTPEHRPPERRKPAPKKKDTGLVIAVSVLLLAIAAVVIYIAISFFKVSDTAPQDNNPGTSTQTQTTTNTTVDTSGKIPCTQLTISESAVELDKVGAALLLNVTAAPENHTDEVTFTSSDETVATVNSKGKITAVGAGQAVITVTCGTQTAECMVTCSAQEEATTTETTPETTVPEVTYSTANFKLNREDFTITLAEKSYKLYDGEIPADQIEWSTSNASVATFDAGVVTLVGKGTATVTATYQGVECTCIVRVI